jgi:hypothetical protein
LSSDLIRRVSKLRPKPGDVIVVELTEQVTAELGHTMRDLLAERFPEQKHLIVCKGQVGLLREVA